MGDRRSSNSSGRGEGPPDLDALLAQFLKKLNKPGSGGTGNKPSPDGEATLPGPIGFGVVLVLVLLVWALAGITIIKPAERAAVLRFGQFHHTLMPGPHWVPRLIDQVYPLNVQRIANFSYQSDMLTKDENIVFVSLSVQYRVDNIRQYLFNLRDPEGSLQQATASALRQVVGHTSLDAILTTGREAIRDEVEAKIKKILVVYQPGLLVTDVNLQPAKPPEQVTEAFDDAIKAREDEQRYINQANAYAKKVVPIARGQAARLQREAAAFQQRVVLDAQAKTVTFLALLPEYQRAKQVTRERLYFDTVSEVLAHTSKILLDVKGGNNVLYLPMSQLLSQAPAMPQVADVSTTSTPMQAIENTVRHSGALAARVLPQRAETPTGLSTYHQASSRGYSQQEGTQ